MLLVLTRSWNTASTKTQVAGERCMRDVGRSWDGGRAEKKGCLGLLHLSLTLTFFP